MKKVFGIKLGGLHQKILNLVLIFMLAMVAVFASVSFYQSRKLAKTVNEANEKQEQSIKQVSGETMQQVVDGTMVKTTALQAYIADDMFADTKSSVMTLQTLAKGLFEHKDSVKPHSFSPPDALNEGKVTAQVLWESGVDYAHSEYLGIASYMSDTMIAMLQNSPRITNCYIGLADGTHLAVDTHSANKFDSSGKQLPFPVRERPWYKNAAEQKELVFSGISEDTYTGKLCVTCSAPVYANGKLVGVVGADLFLDSIADYVQRASKQSGEICVVSNKGQVIFSTVENGELHVKTSEAAEDLRNSSNKALAEFVSTALKEQTKLTELTIDGKEYYAAGASMDTVGWAVVTLVDKSVTQKPTQTMLEDYERINKEATDSFNDAASMSALTTKWMIVLLMVLGSFSALWMAGKIVRPIESMTEDIVCGSQTGKLFEMKDTYKTKDEIEVLAESFDELSKKTKEYIEHITRITKEKERIGTELELARKIQADMLPNIYPAFPDRPEFDIYATMTPAKEVGGDFYDFYLIDDDHLGMVMADVSGKGVPAALFMMMTRILIKNYAMMGYSPAQVLEQTNNTICMNNNEDMFVTVWFGVLEISTGKITAANAGHEFPMLMKPDGDYELFKDVHGFVIGGMEGMSYSEYEIQLEKGGMLYLYTDGVPEAENSEHQMFGTDRLLRALNDHKGKDPYKLLGDIAASVGDFVKDADQFDDLTMLALSLR